MTEYIKREDVEEMLDNAQLISDGEYCGYCTEDVSLYSIPAADVQPVVRCKGCRYSNFDPEYGKRWCNRCLNCMLVKDDDFCSYGERKEPDND